MNYLNLDKDFLPYGNQNYIDYESFTFKGGEPHIKLKTIGNRNSGYDSVTITHRINSWNDLGFLSIAVDALKRKGIKDIHLILPYFPGARQDRLMVQGEPFTSAVYVKELDSMGFQSITSLDLHSDVVAGMFAVLNTKFIDINNHKFVLKVLKDIYPQRDAKIPILISPDAGSNKKIGSLAKYLSDYNVMDVVKCDKTRDVKTGEITDFVVYSDSLHGRDCVIVDDICDGGGTFLGLGKRLKEKGCGKLYLVVTHGIFSQGFKNLNDMFEMVYTTDSIKNYDKQYVSDHKHHLGFVPKIKEIKLKTLL